MTITKKHYFILTLSLLTGLVLPHFDIIIIVLAFTSFLFVPLLVALLAYFTIVVFGGYRRRDRKVLSNGIVGIACLIIFFTSPFISVLVVDKYYQVRASSLIKQLDKYKAEKGHYPANLAEIGMAENIFTVKYVYHKEHKNYSLYYSSCGTVTTRYLYKEKRWYYMDWND